jgi:acyl dehydratase
MAVQSLEGGHPRMHADGEVAPKAEAGRCAHPFAVSAAVTLAA